MSRPAAAPRSPCPPPERPRLLDATNPPVLNDVLFASRDVAERFGGRVAARSPAPSPRDRLGLEITNLPAGPRRARAASGPPIPAASLAGAGHETLIL
jgi:hypothetical protein